MQGLLLRACQKFGLMRRPVNQYPLEERRTLEKGRLYMDEEGRVLMCDSISPYHRGYGGFLGRSHLDFLYLEGLGG